MTRHLLFVDDEPEILEGLRDLLRRDRSRWEMVFAVGANDALERLAQESFDVVVSDMRMPEMDGPQLLAWVRERQPQAVRIVLSGQADVEAAVRAAPVAHLSLAKPCDADTLRGVLERVCALQSALEDAELRLSATKLNALPSVPAVYRELERVLADPEKDARDVADVITGDVAMCAKVLQLVNSAFFGLGRRITSIAEAVSYLGVSTLKTLVLSVSVFAALEPDGETARAAIAELRDHSWLTATIGQRIAGDRERADEAYMAGMLHDVGKLILGAHERSHLEEAVALARTSHCSLAEAELELRGSTHAELGAYLLSLWGLPFEVVEAVARHHEPIDYVEPLSTLAAVQIANVLAAEVQTRSDSGPRELLPAGAAPGESLSRWRAVARETAARLGGGEDG